MHPSRRRFLQTAGLVTGSLALAPRLLPAVVEPAGSSSLTVADLPAGAAPRPVALPHFPSPLHALVWRNWSLVPLDRLAQVIGATPTQIRRLGRAMGLSGPPRISRDVQRRSALTVIRRNWHLLPYDQLLALLDWTPAQLAFALREDDFLFIKLGSLKPQCDPIRYRPSDAPTREHEARIAQLVRRHFPAPPNRTREPLFRFVAELSSAPSFDAAPLPKPPFEPRFCYSYFALYGDPLLDPELDPYPDGYLARLAASGVEGVWLQAVLYQLAPFPWDPARSARAEERRAGLRRLVQRARQQGLGVWLYLNEPRAMPLSFHAAHPGLQGVTEGDHATLCTSVPAVQDYLRDSIASLCRAVPNLAGFVTITASENLTNCWSHHAGKGCPRCAARSPAAVIAEVNTLIRDGIRQANTSARLIAWDWGWADDWAPEAIGLLPPDVILQSVSEWSLPLNRGGIPTTVGEYSISSIGPGPRARRHWARARERGLRVNAKIQAGNTWELSAVPYIPAVANVAQHLLNLMRERVDGLMLGWTLGGYPSPNLEVVAAVATTTGTTDAERVSQALHHVAERRVGPALAPALVDAWQAFSAAFSEFPYHGGLVYNAPMQLGPANPLWGEPTGYRATMVGFPYDDLDGWRQVYPPAIFIAQFEKVADGFDQALATIRTRIAGLEADVSSARWAALAAELRVAEAAALHFRSTANQARFVQARQSLAAATSPADRASLARQLETCLRRELDLAVRLHALQSVDSRLGFEASNQYYYVPLDLAEKVLNCQDLLNRWLPAQRSPS